MIKKRAVPLGVARLCITWPSLATNLNFTRTLHAVASPLSPCVPVRLWFLAKLGFLGRSLGWPRAAAREYVWPLCVASWPFRYCLARVVSECHTHLDQCRLDNGRFQRLPVIPCRNVRFQW